MAFATTAALATRLGVTFTVPEAAQASAFLDDATAYIQGEIGGQLIESGTATVVLSVLPKNARVRLPQWPVRSVATVLVNGTAVTDHTLVDGYLVRASGFPHATDSTYSRVTVTYTYGLVTIPPELASWACVLAAGAIAQVARGGSMSSAGVASERIDDYAVNYSGDSVAMSLPVRILDRLRASYGVGAFVTESV